ncbi:unnamed protein product [Paramecium sonneborni]|uniref:C2H2-type domain-containing protein n=1 Tax=Paramecium sonneborni TaxID=65129 RepID=A0A8S1JXI2_9CILI|nr:unnamed protein product [Paramecium sonneborni]
MEKLNSKVSFNKKNHSKNDNKVWHIFQDDHNNNQPSQQLSLITKPNMINPIQQYQGEIKSQNAKNLTNQCRFCHQRFKNFKALGGHISKRHTGSSQKYIQKMRSYSRNTQQRFNRRILTEYIRGLFGFEDQGEQ